MKTVWNSLSRFNWMLAFLSLNFAYASPVLAQSWVANSPLKVARWAHTASLLTNGNVLIAGGIIYNVGGNLQDTNACELYNPSSGTSILTGPMHDHRHSHTATVLPNGKVLVTGGGGDATSELYNPASSNWSNFAMMNNERTYHTATLLPDGKVLAVAGYDDNNGVELSSAEIYDPASGAWTSTANLPYATDSAAAVLLTNGLVLVCGGSDGNGGAVSNAALYHPTTHTWTSTAAMTATRAGHIATLLPDGTVLVVGGGDFTAAIYDPATAIWTDAATMQNGRQSPQAVLLNNGLVMVCGGTPDVTDVELYDKRNDQWFSTAPLPVPGNYLAATLLPSGQVVVTGGDVSYFNGPPRANVQTYTANSTRPGHVLIAHYPFDASAFGNPNDAQFLSDTSGHGYNIAGPSSFDSVFPSAVTNRIAGVSAVQFHGSNYYNLPKVLLTTVAGSYSLSLWLKTTQVSGSNSDDGYTAPAIVWGGGVGSDYFDSEPMTLTGSKLGFFTGDDGGTLHSATSINSGNFTHLVVTRDQPAGVKKIYVNGVLDAAATGGTNFLADSSDLLLGLSYYHNGVAGIIDDVQFYNGVLTASDVSSLHATPGVTVPDSFDSGTVNSLTVTASPLTGALPLVVNFTSPGVDSGGATVTNWNWNFGDGVSSTAQSPSHTYTNVGTFAPSLVAYSTNSGSPLSVTGPGVVTVTNHTLNVTAAPTAGALPLSVQFTSPAVDSGGNTVTNWNWDFGDGKTSTGQNPVHIYTNIGSFGPSLIARSTFSGTPLSITGLGGITVTNTPNPNFRTLYTFTPAFGSAPSAGLVLAGSSLYGATARGGNTNNGTLFSINTNGAGFTNLLSFSYTNGSHPSGLSLSGGALYGTCSAGGSIGGGTVFAINTNGSSFTNVFNFAFFVPNTGDGPLGGGVLSGNTVYGTTEFGGSFDKGTVFGINTNSSSIIDYHNFSTPSGPNFNQNGDGLLPITKLILSGGTLYGTALSGGTSGRGTVFAMNTNDSSSFRVLHYFSAPDQATGTNNDGASPLGGLVLAGNTLYGTTYAGGRNGSGVVFAVNTDASRFTNLYNFTGGSDGAGPQGGLAVSGNSLYGCTPSSGTTSNGTLFALSTNGTGFTTLYNFTGGGDGSGPSGDMILAGNTLYGVTSSGGSGDGTVFAFTLPLGRPQLTITRSGTNALLTWSTNAPGYTLQSTLSLTGTPTWSPVSPSPVVVNGQNTVTNPISGSQKFYRLFQ